MIYPFYIRTSTSTKFFFNHESLRNHKIKANTKQNRLQSITIAKDAIKSKTACKEDYDIQENQ